MKLRRYVRRPPRTVVRRQRHLAQFMQQRRAALRQMRDRWLLWRSRQLYRALRQMWRADQERREALDPKERYAGRPSAYRYPADVVVWLA